MSRHHESLEPITLSEEEKRTRKLAVQVLLAAKDDAESTSAAAATREDARLFLLGAAEYLVPLQLWTGILGIRARTVQRWAVEKGYSADRILSIPPSIRRLATRISLIGGEVGAVIRSDRNYNYHWTPRGLIKRKRGIPKEMRLK